MFFVIFVNAAKRNKQKKLQQAVKHEKQCGQAGKLGWRPQVVNSFLDNSLVG